MFFLGAVSYFKSSVLSLLLQALGDGNSSLVKIILVSFRFAVDIDFLMAGLFFRSSATCLCWPPVVAVSGLGCF